MARAAALVCVLLCGACPRNPYVIGRITDAGDSATSSPADAAAGECAAAHQNALFCAGFEPSDLHDEWSSVSQTGTGEVERVVDVVHSGSASLRATSAAAGTYAVVVADLPALRSGELHVRSYVYVPAAQPTQIMNLLFVGDSGDLQGVDLNLDDGAVQLFSHQSAQRYTDTRSIPRDRWFCLRLSLSIDDRRGVVRVFVDERMALQTAAFDTLPDDGVSQLRLGIDWSSEQEAFFEVYFDDVVIDTQPVSCAD
jgi:hypothetical protein